MMVSVGTEPGDEVWLSDLAEALLMASEHGPLGILVTRDSDGEPRVARMNGPARALLGGPEIGVDRPLSSYFAAPERDRLLGWLQERRAGSGEARLQMRAARADAGDPALQLSARALTGGAGSAVVVLLPTQDATAAALARSEARFRELIESAPEAIGVGLRRGIAYANRAMLELLGQTSVEPLRDTPFSDHIHEDDAERARASLRRVFGGKAWGRALELRVCRGDGRVMAVEFLGMRILWDQQPAALVIGREIEARRALQSQLIQADRFSSVGTLAAGVAHEINNPLSYVLLNLEFLAKELSRSETTPASRHRLLERLTEARHGAHRVRSIAEDLEAFSRREDPSTVGPVDLVRVARSAMRMVSHEVGKRGRLVDALIDVPRVLGDSSRLEQVLVNLLMNAAQALPEPPSPDAEVGVLTRVDGPWVVLEVTDTGAGIPSELLDRVFDPFFTTKPVGAGTGLGLPISHSIVTSFGGDIAVRSRPSAGTTFRVRLPIAETAPDDSRHDDSPPALGRLRVVIADDEPQVAHLLSRLLAPNHDVEVFTSGASALSRLLELDTVDVVLCDLLMPEVSGMDLFERLRRERPGLERRIVFMTGGAFTPRAAEFLRNTTNPTLAKPFGFSALQSALARVPPPGD